MSSRATTDPSSSCSPQNAYALEFARAQFSDAAAAEQAEELRAEAEDVLDDLEREAESLADAWSSDDVQEAIDAMRERAEEGRSRVVSKLASRCELGAT